jgi:DNA/RNA-binding domain of Phe-tRNA-synthetase-like protein
MPGKIVHPGDIRANKQCYLSDGIAVLVATFSIGTRNYAQVHNDRDRFDRMKQNIKNRIDEKKAKEEIEDGEKEKETIQFYRERYPERFNPG